MTWTFANLRVDAWLDIPPGEKITRGLTQSPLSVARMPPAGRAGRSTKRRQSRATGDVKVLHPGSERNYRPFTGTGTVEEWTLQAMEFY